MGKLAVEIQWAEVIRFLLEKLSNSRIQIFLQKRKQLDIANSMYRLLIWAFSKSVDGSFKKS